jgi:hypothetical protein
VPHYHYSIPFKSFRSLKAHIASAHAIGVVKAKPKRLRRENLTTNSEQSVSTPHTPTDPMYNTLFSKLLAAAKAITTVDSSSHQPMIANLTNRGEFGMAGDVSD